MFRSLSNWSSLRGLLPFTVVSPAPGGASCPSNNLAYPVGFRGGPGTPMRMRHRYSDRGELGCYEDITKIMLERQYKRMTPNFPDLPRSRLNSQYKAVIVAAAAAKETTRPNNTNTNTNTNAPANGTKFVVAQHNQNQRHYQQNHQNHQNHQHPSRVPNHPHQHSHDQPHRRPIPSLKMTSSGNNVAAGASSNSSTPSSTSKSQSQSPPSVPQTRPTPPISPSSSGQQPMASNEYHHRQSSYPMAPSYPLSPSPTSMVILPPSARLKNPSYRRSKFWNTGGEGSKKY